MMTGESAPCFPDSPTLPPFLYPPPPPPSHSCPSYCSCSQPSKTAMMVFGLFRVGFCLDWAELKSSQTETSTSPHPPSISSKCFHLIYLLEVWLKINWVWNCLKHQGVWGPDVFKDKIRLDLLKNDAKTLKRFIQWVLLLSLCRWCSF